MDTDGNDDLGIAARLKRLEAGADADATPFGYDGLLERHALRQSLARRRRNVTRGTAGALVVALVAAGAWRYDSGVITPPVRAVAADDRTGVDPQPRIVRADTYFAVAALEEHIASVDDALNVARAYAPDAAEVSRLERTRDELLESYARVRYAELVSANF